MFTLRNAMEQHLPTLAAAAAVSICTTGTSTTEGSSLGKLRLQLLRT